MIEAIQGKGVNRAKVICDECTRDDVVTCDYERIAGRAWKPNEGQIIRKIEAHGWVLVKGKLRCKACEAKRRASAMEVKEKANEISAKEKLREPTAKQKRDIIGMLEIVYDDDRKRYKDGETDRTVADAVGGGVLWGWVAQLRDEFFGPDMRNVEVEAIRSEIGKAVAEMAGLKSGIAKLEGVVSALRDRLDKVAQ